MPDSLQPLAHDGLEELPGRDLTQDLPVAVGEDGVGVASGPTRRKVEHLHVFQIAYFYFVQFSAVHVLRSALISTG